MGKHTPEPWVMDKAKWGACQWGAWEDADRGEPNLVGGVLPAIMYVRCESNDDHDWAVRSRREDQQDRIISEDERYCNAAHIVDCVNALRGFDVGKVKALLDAVRAEHESKYDDKISVAEHTRRQHVRMNACDELRDSIRAGGGQ